MRRHLHRVGIDTIEVSLPDAGTLALGGHVRWRVILRPPAPFIELIRDGGTWREALEEARLAFPLARVASIEHDIVEAPVPMGWPPRASDWPGDALADG